MSSYMEALQNREDRIKRLENEYRSSDDSDAMRIRCELESFQGEARELRRIIANNPNED